MDPKKILWMLLVFGCGFAISERVFSQTVAASTPPSPTNVHLSQTAPLSLTEGQTLPLVLYGYFDSGPSPVTKALNSGVTWASSNNQVASVSADGHVTGLKAGGPVTISAIYGTLSAQTVTVTVTTPKLISISLDLSGLTVLTAGMKAQFKLNGTFDVPDGSVTRELNSGVMWASSDTSIATISNDGEMTTIKPGGPVTISASYPGMAVQRTNITVAAPTSTSITPANLPILIEGETLQLGLNGNFVIPTGTATQALTSGVNWSSSDTTIVTVSQATGLATAIKSGGPATISATYAGLPTQTTQITVATVSSVSLAPTNVPFLFPGGTETLTLNANFGSGATASSRALTSGVTWSSKDTSIAEISNSGVITAKKPGSVEISATYGKLDPKTASMTVSAPSSFAATPTDQSKTILVNGTTGHNVSIYLVTGDTCSSNSTPLQIVAGNVTSTVTKLTAPAAPAVAPPFELTLAQPVTLKQKLCVADFGTESPSGSGIGSLVVTVGKAPPNPFQPKFDGALVAGSTSFNIVGNNGDTVQVYEFFPGYTGPSEDTCKGWETEFRTSPAIVGGTSMSAVKISTTEPGQTTAVSLSSALVAGYTLCLAESSATTSPSWSKPLTVYDPDNTWRARAYFLVGIQASNQLSSGNANSTTAGQYLEGGYSSEWLRAIKRNSAEKKYGHPGISTNIDLRFSPIPVAASQTTTSSDPSTASTTIPNVLSSQQSVRAVGNLYLPLKLTASSNTMDFFTIAPLARGGFGTLINPTTSAGSNNAGITTATTTAYSPAYYFWSFGSRFAWDHYPGRKPFQDELAPYPIAQFLFNFGEFSNLPSYVCNPVTPDHPYNPSGTVNSACVQGAYSPTTDSDSGQTTYKFFPSRTLIPRLDIEAFLKMPNSPFVIGANANLQQYTVFSKKNVDYLNKPGNDVRVFVGVSINLSSLITKLGAPTI